MANNRLRTYIKTTTTARKTQKYFKTDLAREYAEYVKEYYGTSKKLTSNKVRVTKSFKVGNFKKEQVHDLLVRADILDIKQFKRYRDKYQLSGKEIALKSFNLLDMNIAIDFEANLIEAANNDEELKRQVLNKDGSLKYTREQIRARQLPTEIWNTMKDISARNGQTVSQYFFGSI